MMGRTNASVARQVDASMTRVIDAVYGRSLHWNRAKDRYLWVAFKLSRNRSTKKNPDAMPGFVKGD